MPLSRQAEFREALEDSPIAIFYNMFLHQIFGWPMYLARNASGQQHYPENTNRQSCLRFLLFLADKCSDFSPSAVIFKSSHKWQIIMSDVGVALTLALLTWWGYKRSFAEVAVIYGIPYLCVNQ